MSSISAYIEQNRQDTQRLVGLKYEQLEQLIKQAMRKPPLRERITQRASCRNGSAES
ncbi:hypothetical protein NIES4073_76270 [Kalymmatonema gypsitolerans NIES-4073]|nr:hypothetical protein NIES4073_08360 [Scytonema sp. NIES-4073]BAZ20675.1 hypothetical protein NIES4073_15520 [Scytonema sp. NIES-4073]BAZ21224.1 hypothetical protein NIES4073_21020 [Scytonema sp. NIES-4073]BAZ23911.1 hypothetical protein NIES4073_48020 [Scytonema sp. NIES-4073]BAZ23956.1 hypothetical protein NIES4073_48470 [Scytonema sp. NIES-4073]